MLFVEVFGWCPGMVWIWLPDLLFLDLVGRNSISSQGQFLPNVFFLLLLLLLFLNPIHETTLYLVPYILKLLLYVIFSQTWLGVFVLFCFWDWQFWRRMAQNFMELRTLEFACYFSHHRNKVIGYWEKYHGSEIQFYLILFTVHIINMIYDYWYCPWLWLR